MNGKYLFQKLKHFRRHSVLVQRRLRVIPRVIFGYFKTLVLKRNVLRTIEFTVTPYCNVNCEMCYATKLETSKRDMLSPDAYRVIWRQAKKLGAFSVVLSGGEPTTRPDLFKVVQALEPHKTIIALVTNSTLLDWEYLSKLKASGVTVLHLSLNSVDPEVNDRERDFQGHYEKVNEIIRQAKALDFEVCISTVVSHNRLDRMRQIVRFSSEKDIGVVFSLACPTGEWAGAKEYLLTKEEWKEIDRFMSANPQIRSDWTINFSMRKECPGGREKLCICPYGEVIGCGMNYIFFGNVLQEPLESIWKRTCEWPPFKRRSRKCLIALDEEYLKEYLLPVAGHEILPVSIEQHPVHPMKLSMKKDTWEKISS